MYFIPFVEKFPEIANKETRLIRVLWGGFGIPRGVYCFLESYCAKKNCDCRKVIINVIDVKRSERGALATIGYGWESAKYYVKWMHGDLLGKEMAGSYLEVGGQQSEYANKFLARWNKLVQDRAYVERIKKHYEIWKGQ